MAARTKRAPMPLPGAGESSEPAPPPLPARRAPPAPPGKQPVKTANAAEESASDDDDSYEEPSAKLTPHDDSQELYDEFDMVDESDNQGPPVSPYNPTTKVEPPPQEIYDEFEEVRDEEVYEDPDEKPVTLSYTTNTKSPSSSGNPPPLPPLDNKRRGSTPLPPPPTKRELPPPPSQNKVPASVDQDIYEETEQFDSPDEASYEMEDDAPPPPPPPSGGRPKPPTPNRKKEEKKAVLPSGLPGIGGAVGVADIRGALKGLRKVSAGEKTIDDKNTKNEKNKTEKETITFEAKKTYFAAKNKDGGIISDNHQSNGDKNNNSHSRPLLPPVRDLKPKPTPLIPKLPHEKEEPKNNSNVSNLGSKFGGVKSLITDIQKKPEIASKPLATPTPPLKPQTQTENGGVRTVQLTPRKPPPPSPEEDFPPPPTFEDDDQEIYDDASSQDLDPLSKFAWYQGSVERKQCERLLKSIGVDGTFLVRKSTKGNDQPYTMAVLYQDRVNNLKVRRRDDNRIALGEDKPNEISFKDVEGMVEHHKKHPVLLIGSQKGEITLQSSPRKS